jgi:hypothetical protein
MKARSLPCVLLFAGTLLQIIPFMLHASQNIPNLIDDVDKAQRDVNAATSVQVLRKLDLEKEGDVSSFGSGLGPTTKESFLFSA